jgi:hypothetical protein
MPVKQTLGGTIPPQCTAIQGTSHQRKDGIEHTRVDIF